MTVQEIPLGKVTTYGHIAKLIGKPLCARQVGQTLKHLPNSPTADPDEVVYHTENVPWQRVVSAGGIIPRRDDPGAAQRHALKLREEGVEVGTMSDGRGTVDLMVCGWFPEQVDLE